MSQPRQLSFSVLPRLIQHVDREGPLLQSSAYRLGKESQPLFAAHNESWMVQICDHIAPVQLVDLCTQKSSQYKYSRQQQVQTDQVKDNRDTNSPILSPSGQRFPHSMTKVHLPPVCPWIHSRFLLQVRSDSTTGKNPSGFNSHNFLSQDLF